MPSKDLIRRLGAVFALCGLCASPGAAQESGLPADVASWVRATAVPLGPAADLDDASLAEIGRMIGDARVVALSEGVHGAAEPLGLRNRLFEYLVDELGFTAIAIESGIAESRLVHEYVRGGEGDLDAVLEQGVTWTFDQLPQNRALIEWLRRTNSARPDSDKIDFYGFDVPGSPGNASARRGLRTGLEEAVAYLASVDPEAGANFRRRLPPAEDYRFDAFDDRGYALGDAERDEVTALVDELIERLREGRERYEAASSVDRYAWGLRTARSAKQADEWLRQMPRGWGITEYQAGDLGPFFSGFTVRGQGQADNLRWILDREGPDARVLIFAANFHTSSSAPRTPGAQAEAPVQVVGTYLREWLGDEYFAIGNLIRSGAFGCGAPAVALPERPTSTVAGAMSVVGEASFALALRSAVDAASEWFGRTRSLDASLFVPPSAAFDALIYMDRVSPAC